MPSWQRTHEERTLKIRNIVALAAIAIAVGIAGTLWSWTHTPYGRLDLGAAIVVHTMPSGLGELTPEARRDATAWTARFMGEAPPGLEIRTLEFDAAAGPQPARLYLPEPAGEGPLGVVVWIHGGGFWMGDELEMWDGSCGRLAKEAGVIVVSIGYRLAPEHPFPAAIEDSWAGLLWAAREAEAWGGDPTRLAVMGGSAGANIAAVLAQRARDEGGPPLSLQVLTVPTLNAGGEPTVSMRLFSVGFGLDGIDQMRSAYFSKPGDREHPWAYPLGAKDLSGLAPALIHTAEFDPLRDEGELYAQRLEAAGVTVELHRFDGAIHGFLGSSDARAESERLTAAALRRAIGRP